jgi:hypothetical protein
MLTKYYVESEPPINVLGRSSTEAEFHAGHPSICLIPEFFVADQSVMRP